MNVCLFSLLSHYSIRFVRSSKHEYIKSCPLSWFICVKTVRCHGQINNQTFLYNVRFSAMQHTGVSNGMAPLSVEYLSYSHSPNESFSISKPNELCQFNDQNVMQTALTEKKCLYFPDKNRRAMWMVHCTVSGDQFGKLHENSICASNRFYSWSTPNEHVCVQSEAEFLFR